DIERHDEPVLDCLRDIQTRWLDDDARDTGFQISFIFASNPYFSNDLLEKVYHTQRSNQYVDRLRVTKISATKIDWLPGKNVTVEVVSKKPKNGGR
ncbi:unnamed protein product, partial [Polarella glacialis]